MIEVKHSFTFKDKESIYDFLHTKENHEEFLLHLLNQSDIFNNDLIHTGNENQANAEDDFFSLTTWKSYEATLLLNGKMVMGMKNDPSYLMSDEFIRSISEELIILVRDSLIRKKKKKNIILFNIFPGVANKFYGSFTDMVFSGPFEILINELLEEEPGLFEGKEVLLVSFNIDGRFYINKLYPQEWGAVSFVLRYNRMTFPFRIIDFEVNVV